MSTDTRTETATDEKVYINSEDADIYLKQVLDHLRDNPTTFPNTHEMVARASLRQTVSIGLGLSLLCLSKFLDDVPTWECAKIVEQFVTEARDKAILAAMPDDLKMQ